MFILNSRRKNINHKGSLLQRFEKKPTLNERDFAIIFFRDSLLTFHRFRASNLFISSKSINEKSRTKNHPFNTMQSIWKERNEWNPFIAAHMRQILLCFFCFHCFFLPVWFCSIFYVILCFHQLMNETRSIFCVGYINKQQMQSDDSDFVLVLAIVVLCDAKC